MKTLIFGLGNTILTDDGVGIKVVRELKKMMKENPDVEFKEGSVGGLSILDEIEGFDRLVLVDSIKTADGKPGEVYRLSPEDFNTPTHLINAHGVDFVTAVKLGSKLGYKMPEVIDIYAVQVEDNVTFSKECTSDVQASIPGIADVIMEGL